jgi:hypothetical protein
MKHVARLSVVIALILGCGRVALAERGHGPPHPPPPEAIQACEGLDAGDSCSFSGPRGTIEGTCGRPVGDDLVCVPDRPPPR